MSEETEAGKKRILLRSIYLWTALHVLLAAAVVMWTVDVPQLVAWIRKYWIFFLIVSVGCGSACLWFTRYLSWGAMYSCSLLCVLSTAMMCALCGKDLVESVIFPCLLSSGILYGLLACYGYVTSNKMEGTLFNCIWLFILSTLLATYVTFFREVMVWVPFFVLLGLTFCVPYPQHLKFYGLQGIIDDYNEYYGCRGIIDDYNDPREALRGCMACLAFPLFIVLYLLCMLHKTRDVCRVDALILFISVGLLMLLWKIIECLFNVVIGVLGSLFGDLFLFLLLLYIMSFLLRFLLRFLGDDDKEK